MDERLGEQLYAEVATLLPLPRSITGAGTRETLAHLAASLPLDIVEVPSGAEVLDWTVPQEWVVREAWLQGPDGVRIADFAANPLQLLGYSVPMRGRFSLDELRPHLFTMPDRPDWIPYRTSYYAPNWGFCLPASIADRLPAGEYEVLIDSELIDGSLTYGELILPGSSDSEVLVTTHVCHPAMANDNTTGIVLAAELARRLAGQERRYTYRFLFIPGTIGSITWLARHQDVVGRIAHGLVLTGLGDGGGFVYKRSRRADSGIDRAVAKVLADRGCEARLVDFSPYGYDERQFCSPGFNLPVGRLSRSEHGTYPEYHTSADDLSFVSPGALAEAFSVLTDVVFVLENDGVWTNLSPFGEPQLGRRGLYRSLGATIDKKSAELALLWVLNYSDGEHSLLDIAARSGLAFASVVEAARLLAEADLLKRAG